MVIFKSKQHLKIVEARNQRRKNALMMGDNFKPVAERPPTQYRLDKILSRSKIKK